MRLDVKKLSDEWVLDDINSTLMIRTPSNKMEGIFKLYQTDDKYIDSFMLVYVRDEKSIDSTLTVRVQRQSEIISTLDIKYRGNSEFEGYLEVVGSSYLTSFIEVRPNNRMFGIFEILPPPRVNKGIGSTEDSTTRSREDLRTINYGDSQKMMVGRSEIGTAYEESLESFIRFNNIKDALQNMSILEFANLRLYYAGDFVENTDLNLYLPDTTWSEYGITDANKPTPIELVSSSYTHNKIEKYIEFDIRDLVLKWLDGRVSNLGLIIASNNTYTTSFYTREGRLKPSIVVQFITNEVFSPGRTDISSTMFIYGVGHGDLYSKLTVHSDYGFDYRHSTLYVHRPEAPVANDINSNIVASKPDQHAKLTVAIPDNSDIHASLTIISKPNEDKVSKVIVSKPELNGRLTVDPNITLRSKLAVRKAWDNSILASLTVSRDSIEGKLLIKDRTSIDGFLIVQKEIDTVLSSYLKVSNPEISSYLTVKADDHDDLSVNIEVPNYSNMDSTIAVTREELIGFMDVHTISELRSTLYIKEREYLGATMMIHNTSELNASLDIKYMVQMHGTLAVNRKDLEGFLYPRAIGEKDFNSYTHIRQRDAADLASYFHVGGTFGAYYFIL